MLFFFLMVNLPPRPQPFPRWERGLFNETTQWKSWKRSLKHNSLKFSKPDCKSCRVTCAVASAHRSACSGLQTCIPLRPWQDGATRLTGAFVYLVEAICVPVTLPSLLHCLPLLRRLAAGQRPMEETPFHYKVYIPPAQRYYGLAEQLPTQYQDLPWPDRLPPQKQ